MSLVPFDHYQFNEENFYGALENEVFERHQVANHKPAQYLYNYILDLDAKTIIVEKDYTDADYLDDFAAYYVKCFKHYSRRCNRLHIFTNDFTPADFLAIVRGEASHDQEKLLRKSYLGFIVARPLPSAIIGRSVLKTKLRDGILREFRCTTNYQVNLFGLKLSVKRSLAFQEQDTVLAACATVSLWCSFHRTARLFHTPLPTPAAITRIANQVVSDSRPIPSHELDVQQICHVIRQVGLESEVIRVRKDTPLISLILSYMDVGLPVILIVRVEGRVSEYHAITIAGYSSEKKRVLSKEVAAHQRWIPMTGLYVREFYAHDDQIGPFSSLKVKPSRAKDGVTYPVTFESSWLNDTTNKPLSFYPYAVILPVYHKMRITFLDVHNWLMRLTGVLNHLYPVEIMGRAPTFEWNVYLTTTNAYKTVVKKLAIPQERINSVLLKQYPRFIWRAILSYKGTTILEILADATDMARSFPIIEIYWHRVGMEFKTYELLNDLPVEQLKLIINSVKWPFWKLLLHNASVKEKLTRIHSELLQKSTSLLNLDG